MAPEQAKGQPVDQRADVYSFGLILYDMLVGRYRADHTPTPVEELTGRMKTAPAAVRTIDPSLPEALGGVISRCLDPDPEARYQTSRELEANLDLLDDEGNLLPIERRISPLQLSAAVAGVVALLGTIWWFTYTPPPAVQPDPVTVLIADIENRTDDATFDRTLEPILKIVLEDAGFISAYDRLALRRTFGVPPPEALDQTVARQLAVNQGVGVVLSGSLERRGDGFELSMTVVEAVTGDVIETVEDRAEDTDQVLAVATSLAIDVREALGDDPSDLARRFAEETLSATSLDVVDQYAAAIEALSLGRAGADDALEGFSNAVALDPNFGLAYAGMALLLWNVDRHEDALGRAQQAISHLDSMTERERYRTRAIYYMVSGDSQACVTEYADLVARYPGDTAARNNLALCSSFLRDWPTALDTMRQLVQVAPGRALYRENLAAYESYSGDFETAEQEARSIDDPELFGLLALAFAQVGQGQLSEASDTYQTLGAFDTLGASFRDSGLGDLAMYEGRFSDAERIFREAATQDLANDESYRAAAKLAAIAHTHVLRGDTGEAIAAAEDALSASEDVKIRFLTARVFVEAGEMDRARMLAEGLASEFQIAPRSYAKIIEGEVALKDGDPREAITLLTDANGLLDTWMGHFDLGRAYLEAGALLQAEGEFDRCITRRGEAVSLFLDEEPTYGYFPPVYYYQGRVREAMNNAAFADSYRQYLDIRGNSTEDLLLPDVRQRAGL